MMEIIQFTYSLTTINLVLFFFLPILFIFLSILRTNNKATPKLLLPPGPRKFPLIGNLHNLAGSRVPHRSLHELSLKHGPVMHLQLGEISTVIISSPAAAKQVMKTHDLNFASRPRIIVAEIIHYGCTNIGFSPYGDYWRQLRKICALELLSTARVQSLRPIREEVCSNLAKWIASREGTPVNLSEKLYSSSYDFTTRAAVGEIKSTEGKEDFLRILKGVLESAAGFDIAEVYPSVRLIQLASGLRRRVKRLHKEMDGILDDIIREHQAVLANHDDGSQKKKHEDDLVDVLLNFQEDGLELPLTTDNIKAVIFDILGGGSETSATTMDWAMVELLKNPKIMENVQDEVRRVFDDKGHVDESRIQELEYLKSVVKETLRLHPPATLLLPRISSQKCKIDGYDIPADTKIIINAWAINRDPEYWENGSSFVPERFLDNMSSVDYKGNHFEYIPFGAGRRICPGISFGIANVELPLATLLYHFDWSLCARVKHAEEMDMSEGFGVTARRKKDLSVVPVVRRPC